MGASRIARAGLAGVEVVPIDDRFHRLYRLVD
jgi:hypothetical protein